MNVKLAKCHDVEVIELVFHQVFESANFYFSKNMDRNSSLQNINDVGTESVTCRNI